MISTLKARIASALAATSLLAVAADASAASSALTPLCDNPSKLCTIEPSKYLGAWYEIGRTGIISDTFEADLACVKANYALENATTISVTNTGYNTSTKAAASIVGSGKIDNDSELTVTFGANDFGGVVSEFFQGLLGPNYKIQNVWVDSAGNYQRALVVNSILGIEFVWILSRTPTISEGDIQESLAYVEAAGYLPELEGWALTPCTAAERAALPAADR